ncbi:MAG: hypothetical protein WCI04_01645 [archaeon]
MAQVKITQNKFVVKVTKNKIIFGKQYNPHTPIQKTKNPIRVQIAHQEQMIKQQDLEIKQAEKRFGENSAPVLKMKLNQFGLMAAYSELKWKLAQNSLASTQPMTRSKSGYAQEEIAHARRKIKALNENLTTFEEHYKLFSGQADKLKLALRKRKGFKE